MAQPALQPPAPALWLVEQGREARRLAALTPEGPQRDTLLAIAKAFDDALFARGLPTVEDLEHWDDPVVGTPEQHRRWLETGEGGPWLDSLS